MKRAVISCFLLLTVFAAGCSREPSEQPAASVGHAPSASAPEVRIVAPSPASAQSLPPVPATDGAASAQGLSSEEVLNRASFLGGTLGDRPFHGGQVLLWKPEPNRYRLRASLDLGGGQWRSTDNTNELIFDPATPFIASVALLNDVEEAERAVPLWVFFGHVENPEIALVEVRMPGVHIKPVEVKRSTWLAVHQGVLLTGPNQTADVIAYRADRTELTRTTTKLGVHP